MTPEVSALVTLCATQGAQIAILVAILIAINRRGR